MGAPSKLGAQLFELAPLPDPVQRLLIAGAPELRDAAANNPFGLRPDVWRACYTDAPASRARTLLTGPLVTADDIDWVLRDVRERRTGPLTTLLNQWHLDADQQQQLTVPSVPANLAMLLEQDTALLPAVRLRAAARAEARLRLDLLGGVGAADIDDATVLTAVTDIETWPVPDPPARSDAALWQSQRDDRRAKMLSEAVRVLAVLAHSRPQLAVAFADSGVVTLAAAAAAAPLAPGPAAQVIATCTAALGDQIRGDVAITGLLCVADRPDVAAATRAAAVAALTAHDGGRSLARHGVSGAGSVLPAGTAVADLSAAQLELLLIVLRDESGPLVTARSLLLTELASAPALDEQLALRLLAAFSEWRLPQRVEWLPVLLGRFPQLAEDAAFASRQRERTAKQAADARAAWVQALTPGAVRRRPVRLSTPTPTSAEFLQVEAEYVLGLRLDRRAQDGVRALAAALGDNPAAWLFAVHAGDEFSGTLGELAQTALAASA